MEVSSQTKGEITLHTREIELPAAGRVSSSCISLSQDSHNGGRFAWSFVSECIIGADRPYVQMYTRLQSLSLSFFTLDTLIPL